MSLTGALDCRRALELAESVQAAGADAGQAEKLLDAMVGMNRWP